MQNSKIPGPSAPWLQCTPLMSTAECVDGDCRGQRGKYPDSTGLAQSISWCLILHTFEVDVTFDDAEIYLSTFATGVRPRQGGKLLLLLPRVIFTTTMLQSSLGLDTLNREGCEVFIRICRLR